MAWLVEGLFGSELIYVRGGLDWWPKKTNLSKRRPNTQGIGRPENGAVVTFPDARPLILLTTASDRNTVWTGWSFVAASH